jgi:2-polyprenyl-6-methoxyphenol hydroxylase-like FAD-dependent oxidoreductase
MDQDDRAVRIEFDGRDELEHDIAIGADGMHSKVAELLDIDFSGPLYSDANTFYG